MTDEQIIEALKCCNGYDCETCMALKYCDYTHSGALARSSLDIINSQKAKIEKLKTEIERIEKELTEYKLRLKMSECTVDEIKSDAIKEFAERLKSKVNDLEFRTKTHRKTVPTKFCDDNANLVMHECVPEEIDNLVKELTEVEE